MKIRNKKTGTIVNVLANPVFTEYNKDGSVKNVVTFNSLAELNEEWEDYEEPKTAWFIDSQGDIQEWRDAECDDWTNEKSIGNYFETKEEAERAVEKLKAWKRLKDKGFINKQVFSMNLNWCNPDDDDWEAFHLLFGGEE